MNLELPIDAGGMGTPKTSCWVNAATARDYTRSIPFSVGPGGADHAVRLVLAEGRFFGDGIDHRLRPVEALGDDEGRRVPEALPTHHAPAIHIH